MLFCLAALSTVTNKSLEHPVNKLNFREWQDFKFCAVLPNYFFMKSNFCHELIDQGATLSLMYVIYLEDLRGMHYLLLFLRCKGPVKIHRNVRYT